jgi:hypothetical protein
MLFSRNIGRFLIRFGSKFDQSKLTIDKKNASANTQIQIFKNKIKTGPHLKHFIQNDAIKEIKDLDLLQFETNEIKETRKRNVYFEVYGCQVGKF